MQRNTNLQPAKSRHIQKLLRTSALLAPAAYKPIKHTISYIALGPLSVIKRDSHKSGNVDGITGTLLNIRFSMPY